MSAFLISKFQEFYDLRKERSVLVYNEVTLFQEVQSAVEVSGVVKTGQRGEKFLDESLIIMTKGRILKVGRSKPVSCLAI